MTTITASMVKELREKTGAGMMDCKKALTETGGDLDQAVDELRKRGQALADKRGGRATEEGLIFTASEGDSAVMVELNCETDFVARNEQFNTLGAEVAALVLANPQVADLDQLQTLDFPKHGKPVAEVVTEAIGKIGENMGIRRFIRVDAGPQGTHGAIFSYLHPPGKLGVLLVLGAGKADTLQQEAFTQLGRDLAMHVTAAAPLAIAPDAVNPADLDRERSIYADQAKMEGKPEAIIDRIVEGKVGKYLKDICLLQQAFVKEPDQSVAQWIETAGKQLDDQVTVRRFERFVVGGDQATAQA